MQPALWRGQRRLLRTDPLALNRLRRGDIVVLRHPWHERLKLVKRLAAIPGDLVSPEGDRLETGAERAGWLLGSDEYFVVSDNRERGTDDSRRFGPVRRRLIEGCLIRSVPTANDAQRSSRSC